MTITLSIFKIFSSFERELNYQQNLCSIFHHTLILFPLYLGKVNSSNLSQITTDKFAFVTLISFIGKKNYVILFKQMLNMTSVVLYNCRRCLLYTSDLPTNREV